MAERSAALPPCPGLTPQELGELLAIGTLRSFQKNTVVLSEGDETDSVFFILSGRVKIFLGAADGGEVVVNTQQTIANIVGASREMVSRILKDLRVGGYLATEGRRIVILKKPPAAW